ncbi:MAG: NUDIX hydrolase [Rhodospirillales bacterium]|nr:NUDIX hydrolase [Rhodospirillales bacterium]
MPDPAIARPAASVIVLCRRRGALRLLMGWRGAGHRFMPNRLVFPGGGVDPGDFAAMPASPLAAPTRAALLAETGGGADAALAAALGMAAARELAEETGLTLGSPPALAGLRYLMRLITPAALPIRFDARFFLLDRACLAGSLAGSGELEGLDWLTPEEALAQDLAIPTRRVVERVQALP